MAAQSALCRPLLQLRPRASAWGRESRQFISGPWKKRKGRAENGNLGGECAVETVISLRRGWNWGTRDRGHESLRGPTGVPPGPWRGGRNSLEERWSERGWHRNPLKVPEGDRTPPERLRDELPIEAVGIVG